MSNETQKSTFFAVVDEMLEVPETGELKIKDPIYRDHVFYVNSPGFTGPDGITHRASAKKLVPDSQMGIYEILMKDPDAKKAIAVMTEMVKDPTNPIIGPFNSYGDALQAKNDKRKRCPSELAAERGRLVESQNVEIDALKARISELEKKGK